MGGVHVQQQKCHDEKENTFTVQHVIFLFFGIVVGGVFFLFR